MKIYFAADHAGFGLKQELITFLRERRTYEIEDCGALTYDADDDYPGIIADAARKLSADVSAGLDSRAILIGGSGQGEAMAANRFKGVRAAVFYGWQPAVQTDITGELFDMIVAARRHNNANALALGAHFITIPDAERAISEFILQDFLNEIRHERRIAQLDTLV